MSFLRDPKEAAKFEKGRVFESSDIVSYYMKEVVKKVGEGEDDFVVEKVLTEYDRTPREDYINSFANDVGVKNMIRKAIANGQDPSICFRAKGGYVDLTKAPGSMTELEQSLQSADKAYESLPADMKKAHSKSEAHKITREEIEAYVSKAVAAHFASKSSEVKGDKENG